MSPTKALFFRRGFPWHMLSCTYCEGEIRQLLIRVNVELRRRMGGQESKEETPAEPKSLGLLDEDVESQLKKQEKEQADEMSRVSGTCKHVY